MRRAEEDHFEVDGDGWVSDPTTAGLPHQDPDAQQIIADRSGLLGEHRAAVDTALADAQKASNDGTKALAELNGEILTDPMSHDAAAESAQDVKNAMQAIGVQGPQVPENDPKAAAEWSKALNPEERQTYTTLYPKEIGATDGLPSDVRDDANRTALTQELNLIQEGNWDEGFPGESDETELLPETAEVHFEACVGENGEVAEDGRYSFFYYVYSSAPATDHTRMVRKLRGELPQHGYEMTAYREFESAYVSAVFRARNKKNDYSVEAETVGSGKTKPQRFSFAVRTPACSRPATCNSSSEPLREHRGRR